MSSRIYNKLYVNKNREEGSEKLTLGYMLNSRELLLKKDSETIFSVPQYTDPILLTQTNIIASGAIGGPFPAAADRIYKCKKNYGSYTPYGDPSDIADGSWFCSWLYKTPEGTLQWMDRYYNPGAITNIGLLSGTYVSNNPVFRDVASTLLLEPGVQYKYFHLGELTAEHIVTTFSGVSSEKILMDLSNWENGEQIDMSPSKLNLKIASSNSSSSTFSLVPDNTKVSKKCLKFDGSEQLNVSLEHDFRYTPINEFTAAFWCQSPKWNDLPSTQLIGNYSSNGGWGLFVQNLDSYPFFVLPETNYGHLLYINEGLNGYLDQSVQEIPKVPAAAAHVAIDFNQHAVVCIEDNSGIIYKLDNAGKIIAHSKQTTVPFEYVFFNEIPIQIMIGHNNTILVRTSKMIYTLDDQLNKISQLLISSTKSDVMSYRYNSSRDFYELHVARNVLDSKFIQTTQWSISADGNLYKTNENSDPELMYRFTDKATNFSIDPYNRLWVAHGNNLVTVIESNAAAFDSPLFSIVVGNNIPKINKNLNFFSQFNSKTKEKEWLAVVYYSDENFLHVINMQGKTIKVIDMFSLFNGKIVKALEQSSDNFKFLGKGDFTGYEHRRVFKQLSPFLNRNQLVLKLALQNTTNENLSFDHFVKRIPIDTWTDYTWQHIILTLKHQTFSVYVNGQQQTSLNFTGKNALSYVLSPLFYIGSSAGSQSNFNKEIQNVSELFEGLFADIKIYNYAIDPQNYEMFLRAANKGDSIIWSRPTPDLQYVEKIDHLFKQKIPGHKSPFYRIKLKGTHIKDENLKLLIERRIRDLAFQTNPAYVDFLSIIWVD